MSAKYDVIILGCGEAGIFAAYELMHRSPGPEGGGPGPGRGHLPPQLPHRGGQGEGVHPLQGVRHHVRLRRSGGLLRRQVQLHHRRSAAGSPTSCAEEEVMELIDYVDSINVAHGATDEVLLHRHPGGPGAGEAGRWSYDLHLLQARCKHLGTENNLRILTEHL